MMRLRRHWLTIGAILLIASALAYLLAPWWQARAMRQAGQDSNRAALTSAMDRTMPAASPDPDMVFGPPASLQIPRLEVQLAIKPGYYNVSTQTWTLNRADAFWMQSPTPNVPLAMPVIYGHNIPGVFRALDGVAADEPLWITLQDGRRLLFRYADDQVVPPANDVILRSDFPNSVLLMTCTGAHFQERRVLHFVYAGEQTARMAHAGKGAEL